MAILGICVCFVDGIVRYISFNRRKMSTYMYAHLFFVESTAGHDMEATAVCDSGGKMIQREERRRRPLAAGEKTLGPPSGRCTS